MPPPPPQDLPNLPLPPPPPPPEDLPNLPIQQDEANTHNQEDQTNLFIQIGEPNLQDEEHPYEDPLSVADRHSEVSNFKSEVDLELVLMKVHT